MRELNLSSEGGKESFLLDADNNNFLRNAFEKMDVYTSERVKIIYMYHRRVTPFRAPRKKLKNKKGVRVWSLHREIPEGKRGREKRVDAGGGGQRPGRTILETIQILQFWERN